MLQPEVCFVASLARLMLAQKDIKITGKVLNKFKKMSVCEIIFTFTASLFHFAQFFVSYSRV